MSDHESGRHRRDRSVPHVQRPVAVRGWEFHRPQSTGRHRMVCPRGVAGLAWPGEATARLLHIRRGGRS